MVRVPLTDQISKALGARHFTKNQKGALSRIVMHGHHEALGSNRAIYYARSSSSPMWNNSYRRQYFGFRLVINAVNHLKNLGFIDHCAGIPGLLGRQSEFRATRHLISCVSGMQYDMLPPDDPIIIRGELIEDIIPKPNAKNAKSLAADMQELLDTA